MTLDSACAAARRVDAAVDAIATAVSAMAMSLTPVDTSLTLDAESALDCWLFGHQNPDSPSKSGGCCDSVRGQH